MNVKATTVNIWAQNVNQNAGGGGSPPVPTGLGGAPSGGQGGGGAAPAGGGGFRGLPLTSMLATGLGLAAGATTLFGQAEQRELAKRVTAETSKEFFRLQNLRGDFTNLAFEKEKEEGKEKAQGKGTMATSDILSALSIPLALLGGPVGAGLGLGVRALGVGAGIMGGVNAAPAIRDFVTGQYSEGLDARYQSNLLTTQQNAMMQDPVKRAVIENLMGSRASTTGVYESARFGSLLGKSDFEKSGGVQATGMLLGQMGAGDAQRTAIKNLAEGVKQGMDQTQNAKEFRQFVQLLTQAQVTSKLTGEAQGGATQFNELFSRTFSDTKTTRGLESGMEARGIFNQMAGETAYQAATFAAFNSSSLGRNFNKQIKDPTKRLKLLNNMMLSREEGELTATNPAVMEAARMMGVDPTSIVRDFEESFIKGSSAFSVGGSNVQDLGKFRESMAGDKKFREFLGSSSIEGIESGIKTDIAMDVSMKRGIGVKDSALVNSLTAMTDPYTRSSSKASRDEQQIIEMMKGRQFTDKMDTAKNSVPEKQREDEQGTGKQGFEATEEAASRFAKALDLLSSKIEAMTGETYNRIQSEDRQSARLGAPK